MSAGEPPDLRESLERELRRVTDRLRTLSLPRLAEPVAGHPSGAAAARALAQRLADAAAALESPGSSPPVRREVPVLADVAVGDQVAVTGADLLQVAGEMTEAGAREAEVHEALARMLQEVRELRRAL